MGLNTSKENTNSVSISTHIPQIQFNGHERRSNYFNYIQPYVYHSTFLYDDIDDLIDSDIDKDC